LIGSGLFRHLPQIHTVYTGIQSGFQSGLSSLGRAGLFFLFLKAFSMGGGTFTGIEAVSNGLQVLREPRVENGKKNDALYGRLPGHHGSRHLCLLPAAWRYSS
jgi:hypothetical protein